MSNSRKSDTDLEIADKLERQMPARAEKANAELLKLSQGSKSPVFVIIYRRRGVVNAIIRDLEAPFRRGEPALVLSTESVLMAQSEVSCWDIEYYEKRNGDYPKRVELPIMDYVWELVPASQVGRKYYVKD